jgi:outer membrane receptor for ferrienterochelin and colicins
MFLRAKAIIAALVLCVITTMGFAQTASVSGTINGDDGSLPYATVELKGTTFGAVADESGHFQISNVPFGNYTVRSSFTGYKVGIQSISISEAKSYTIDFDLASMMLDEIVVSGSLKEMRKLDSPVAIEVYQPTYFRRNPTPNIYEALQNVNGVRPQLNCNVCNTGDIHINGLEGPYTMILIDGMPIVGGLSSVYGLSGIPNSMIERIEVVKGPASTLYGSEAVGGLINVITKKTASVPLLSIDAFATSWQEYNVDVALKTHWSKRITSLTGINYFNYKNPKDLNGDNFTDVTLQDRVSIFQKWSLNRKSNRVMSLAVRYLYEDRWGGEMHWTPEYRGGDSVYAESIYTNRWEVVGVYQLPTEEKLLLSYSANVHDQNSVYGKTIYNAKQNIGFAQLVWDKKAGRHDFITGSALRYTYYDDNTAATSDPLSGANLARETWLPGIFVQDQIGINEFIKVLSGIRYDYNSNHGSIFTPRAAVKWSPNTKNIFRLNAGTGYRVVNLFTEEHAALTGSREVVIEEELRPETSYNVNLNYVRRFYWKEAISFGVDASSWYTLFTNQILPDYDTDPDKIIYDNLDGYSVSRGAAINADFDIGNRITGNIGATYMDVFVVEETNGAIRRYKPVLTETWSGIWSLTYKFQKLRVNVDYTGNLYGPMRLPTLGVLDPRDDKSPWWSIQNIQITHRTKEERIEFYGGVKNLLNFTPAANSIARANDPFDKKVLRDEFGAVIPTPNNPNGMSFDPSYVYAPNQGIRGFAGIRIKWL